MKKALALFLALVMVFSTMVTLISAATPVSVDLKEFFEENGYASTYVGKALSDEDAKPVQDGVISDKEYQAEYFVSKDGTKDTSRRGAAVALRNDYKEYIAHDAEWIYFAAEFDNVTTDTRGRFYWNLFFLDSFEYQYNGGSSANAAFVQNGNGIKNGWLYGGEVKADISEGYSERGNTVTSGTAPVIGTDVYVGVGKEDLGASEWSGWYNAHQIYEFKVSKAWYAAQAGLASAEDVVNLAWITMGQQINSGGSAYTQIGHVPTTDVLAALETLGGVAYTGNASNADLDDDKVLPRFFILDDEPSEEPVPETKKAAPILDGVVNDGEYAVSRVFPKTEMYNPSSTEITSDATEYFSHNADYVYYALTFNQATEHNRAVIPNMKFTNTFDIFYNNDYTDGTTIDDYFYSRFTYQLRHKTDGGSIYHTNAAVLSATAESNFKVAPIAGKDIIAVSSYDADTALKTYEIRIDKAYIANSLGIEKADVRVIPYFVTFHDSCYIAAVYTADDVAAITEAGAEFVPAVGAGGFRFMILDTEPAEEESDWGKFAQAKGWNTYVGEAIADEEAAEDTTPDWEAVTNARGLNTYIGAPMKVSPIVDGIINEGEYTYSRTVETTDIHNYAGGEIQSAVTEYFAHDADYVYYAASFTQANDGRAFMWKFVPFNSFDVFNNTPPRSNHYDYRINWQVRYNPAYTTPPLVNYDGGWGPTMKDNITQVPTIYKTMAAGQEEELIARATKDANNVKYYEVKLSKDYLAGVNQCAKEDIRVIPYFTWFHDSACVGQWYDAEDAAAIKAADPTAYVPSGIGYNFIVLDEAPKVFEEPYQNLTHKLGLNVYVGEAMEVSPVVDGVVNPGEYSYSRTWGTDEIIGYSAELQSEVVEYIAHDADYVYYAAVFEQTNNNRAFQWYFVPRNTAAVFNDKTDLSISLHQRIVWQLRYQDNGTTTVAQNPSWNYAQDIATPVVGSDLQYAATKTAGNIKTYEIKLAKSYIAGYAGCEVEDVTVVPYMTYFHSGPALAHNYTAEEVAAITALGATRADTGNLYRFIILDEAPNGVEVLNPISNVDTTTKDGASIRVSTSNPGLRFKTIVNTAELNALIAQYGAANVKVGTLIAPDDVLGENALTINTETKVDVVATLDMPFEQNGIKTTYAGSLTNIRPQNLTRDFTAVGYIAYRVSETAEWIYVYAPASCTRNVTEIAQAALDAGEFADNETAIGILKDLGAVAAE